MSHSAEIDACDHSSTTGVLVEQDDGSWVEEDVRCIFCGCPIPPEVKESD